VTKKVGRRWEQHDTCRVGRKERLEDAWQACAFTAIALVIDTVKRVSIGVLGGTESRSMGKGQNKRCKTNAPVQGQVTNSPRTTEVYSEHREKRLSRRNPGHVGPSAKWSLRADKKGSAAPRGFPRGLGEKSGKRTGSHESGSNFGGMRTK